MSCMAAVLDVLHKKLIDQIFFIARQQRQLRVTLHLKHKTKNLFVLPEMMIYRYIGLRNISVFFYDESSASSNGRRLLHTRFFNVKSKPKI